MSDQSTDHLMMVITMDMPLRGLPIGRDGNVKHDKLYMRIAHTLAAQSHCERLKVGSVIVRDSNIVAFGWNGTPSGFHNCCECDGETKPEVVHAEANALAKAARSTISTKGATMYLTHSPCWNCALLMLQSGISRVVYETLYRDSDPIDLLKKAGVNIDVCQT